MTIRGRGHRTFARGTGWLLLIFLLCLSGRCAGQTYGSYDGFSYSVSGTNITITGYTNPIGALTIPSSIPGVGGTVTAIGSYAFNGCVGLTSVTIPTGVTSIEEYAFSECSGLASITIPSSVASLGEAAFYECRGLASVTIPSSVTSIGDEAFYECSDLTSVTIPSSVTYIGSWAFMGCSRLTAFTVDTQNPSYSSLGGVLFNKNQTTLVERPPAETGAYAIPSSVTSIGIDAFYECGGLTSVAIPGGVTNIGNAAFYGCSGLTSVTIPSSVTSIGGYAFYGCSGLTSVAIPNSVTFFGYRAFYECGGLTSAYFQGNAPSGLGPVVFAYAAPGFSIYYPSTASGWSTPTWNGYPAQPYPLLTLTLGSGAVTPSFNYLLLGTNYQLQVSTDLNTWSNTGPVFSATNASAAYAQPFNVGDSSQLFFRLVSAP